MHDVHRRARARSSPRTASSATCGGTAASRRDIYIYTYVCMHVCVYIYIYIYVVCVCMYIYIYIYMSLMFCDLCSVYACMHACMHAFRCRCSYMNTTYSHIYDALMSIWVRRVHRHSEHTSWLQPAVRVSFARAS